MTRSFCAYNIFSEPLSSMVMSPAPVSMSILPCVVVMLLVTSILPLAVFIETVVLAVSSALTAILLVVASSEAAAFAIVFAKFKVELPPTFAVTFIVPFALMSPFILIEPFLVVMFTSLLAITVSLVLPASPSSILPVSVLMLMLPVLALTKPSTSISPVPVAVILRFLLAVMSPALVTAIVPLFALIVILPEFDTVLPFILIEPFCVVRFISWSALTSSFELVSSPSSI